MPEIGTVPQRQWQQEIRKANVRKQHEVVHVTPKGRVPGPVLLPPYSRSTPILLGSYSNPTAVLLGSCPWESPGKHGTNGRKTRESGNAKAAKKEIDGTMHQRTLTPCPSPGRRGEQLALSDRRERKPPVAGHASAVPGEGMEIYPRALPASRQTSTVTSSSACAWHSRMKLFRRSSLVSAS